MPKMLCLKCDEQFDSKDKVRNRLCKRCQQENKYLNQTDPATVFRKKQRMGYSFP